MRKLLVSVILLVLIALSLRSFFRDRIPALGAQFLTKTMHVPVELKKAVFYKEAFQIEGFSIRNPKAENFKNAISIETIHIEAPYSRYFLQDPLIIQHIFLENVRINLEISKDKTTACNWNIITGNMNANHTHWYSNERKAFLKKLILRNVVIGVKLYGKKIEILSPIPIIEFQNVDVNNGLPMQEISKIIIDKLTETVFAAEAFKRIIGLPFQVFIQPFESSKGSCSEYRPDPAFKILAQIES